MRPFEYVSATSRNQVGELLGKTWADAEILAGGTDLVALMKDEIVTPKRVVNIKEISDLRGSYMRDPREPMFIGALTTLAELAELKQDLPAIAEAAGEAASPQIRNMATVGGNLCQRPRCWYFRNGMGLLPRDQKTGKSLVLEGDNRYHAILGNDGPAYFVSPSTLVPALIAHGAKVRILGNGKLRELPLENFYVIPKKEGEREHDLQPNELVVGVSLPSLLGLRAANYEVRQKEVFDWPLATCSVALDLSGTKVLKAKVVLGHVAPIPWISKEAAKFLIDKDLTPETAAAAADAALANAKSLGKNRYKITVAKAAVKRALLKAAKSDWVFSGPRAV